SPDPEKIGAGIPSAPAAGHPLGLGSIPPIVLQSTVSNVFPGQVACMTSHPDVLRVLLDKALKTLEASDSGRDIAPLIARAAEVSRELDELTGDQSAETETTSKIDEIRKRREAKKRGA